MKQVTVIGTRDGIEVNECYKSIKECSECLKISVRRLHLMINDETSTLKFAVVNSPKAVKETVRYCEVCGIEIRICNKASQQIHERSIRHKLRELEWNLGLSKGGML